MTMMEFLDRIEALSLKMQDLSDEMYSFRFSNAAIKDGELEALARRCEEVAAMLRELEMGRFPQDRNPCTKNPPGGGG